MCGQFRSVAAFLVVIVCIFASSCKQATPIGYDRLKLQLLTEAFAAVHQRDHDLAVSRLEKLQSSEFIESMIKREREGMALDTIRKLTEEGKLTEALDACEEGIVQCGRAGRLPDAEASLRVLIAIRAYKDGQPYTSSVKLKKALDPLPPPVSLNNDSTYVRWLNQRRRIMLRLQAKERELQFKETVRKLDDALISGKDIGKTITTLKQIQPSHPLIQAWGVKNLRGEGLSAADKERLALGLYRSRLATVEMASLPAKPETPSGELLAIVRLMRQGKTMAGVASLLTLRGKFETLDVTPIAPLIRTALRKHTASLAPTDLAKALLTLP